MKAYFIKIGDKEIGPFTTKAAAVAEGKALKNKGFTVNVSQRTVSDTALFEAFGNPESEIDLDADIDADIDDTDDTDDDDDDTDDDDIDIDALFDDDDDDDTDDDTDDDDDDTDDDAPDDKPEGSHPWYKGWGS